MRNNDAWILLFGFLFLILMLNVFGVPFKVTTVLPTPTDNNSATVCPVCSCSQISETPPSNIGLYVGIALLVILIGFLIYVYEKRKIYFQKQHPEWYTQNKPVATGKDILESGIFGSEKKKKRGKKQ